NIENLFIDFEYKKGKYKLKSIFKNVFGNETDNFHIRYYKSDYYVHYLKSESKVLTFFEPPVFSEQLIKDIAFKQLISSQALCKGIPIRTECYVNLDKSNFEYSPLNGFANDWRMVVGKGISSVFESGMSIHHTYGIPYIPASAVKGILRSWIISEYFSNNGNDLEKAECRALRNFDFCKIFGTQEKTTFIKDKKVICEAISPLKNIKNETTEHIGNIVFFDAFPTKVPTVSVDIMNPHYPKYYNHDAGSDDFQPPADWQSPVPIFFLTVKDTSFQFLFGIRKEQTNPNNY
ncbi:MAG: type III-B CRISPR module RAMP protein Cmr6, partial [Bacteroidetes bacterium 4572_117]